MPVAVIVQAMVPADVAGVLFTANPVSKNSNQIMVEAVYGLGEQLVQGQATPDNYLVDKASGALQGQTIAKKTVRLDGGADGVSEHSVEPGLQSEPALTPAQLNELSKLSAQLETKFGHPLDIEFAYATGQLSILQARPITTL
jgi:pyruvate,water dikinase